MGVPSLNDLAVDGTLNTTNQPKATKCFCAEMVPFPPVKTLFQ